MYENAKRVMKYATYINGNTFPAKTTWATDAMYVILTIAKWTNSVSRLENSRQN